MNKVSLYVGHLGFDCTDEDLLALFAPFGAVSACVARRRSGKTKGFGHVEFASELERAYARQQMQGKVVEGRVLIVQNKVEKNSEAVVEKARPQRREEEKVQPKMVVAEEKKRSESSSYHPSTACLTLFMCQQRLGLPNLPKDLRKLLHSMLLDMWACVLSNEEKVLQFFSTSFSVDKRMFPEHDYFFRLADENGEEELEEEDGEENVDKGEKAAPWLVLAEPFHFCIRPGTLSVARIRVYSDPECNDCERTDTRIAFATTDERLARKLVTANTRLQLMVKQLQLPVPMDSIILDKGSPLVFGWHTFEGCYHCTTLQRLESSPDPGQDVNAHPSGIECKAVRTKYGGAVRDVQHSNFARNETFEVVGRVLHEENIDVRIDSLSLVSNKLVAYMSITSHGYNIYKGLEYS